MITWINHKQISEWYKEEEEKVIPRVDICFVLIS
jgi:hypothetical protein